MPIYRDRKVYQGQEITNKTYKPHATVRPPGNIPYVVVNLWEWKRPLAFPNRRFSAFDSPLQN